MFRIGRSLRVLAIVELIGLFAFPRAIAGTVPSVTEYPVPNNSPPYYIASDSADDALWFTTNTEIGRISTSGKFTEYPAIGLPTGIALGPDGALWFAEASGNGVGQFTTTGNSNYFQVLTPNANVFEIAAGPDGAMWATEFEAGRIARITTSGVVTEFTTPTRASHPFSIVAGPDRALWFTEEREGNIGRITTDGVVTEFPIPIANAQPQGITVGADGALWFSNQGGLGRITTNGVISEYPIGGGQVIRSGPDGALWYGYGDVIRRVNISGQSPVATDFTVPTKLSGSTGIAAGPDGAMWFTEYETKQIGRITLPTNNLAITLTSQAGGGRGQVTSSSLGATSLPGIACTGSGTGCSFDFPAGNLVTLTATAALGSVFQGWSGGGCSGSGACVITASADTAVTATFEPTPTAALVSLAHSGNGSGTISSMPSGINCGSTCNASFALNTPITFTATATAGSTFIGWSGGGCVGIQACTLTFTQATTVENTVAVSAGFVANTTSDVALAASILPASRSVQVGTTATFFGTMINGSSDTSATNCTIAPATQLPASFFFQTTDYATNNTTGTINTPVTITPGKPQGFLLGFTPTATFDPTNVVFNFTCTNAPSAPTYQGVNTLLLSSSQTPTPDVIALAATFNRDGIVDIPGPAGAGAFAVATANVGASGTITAAANVGMANLPVTVTICQTNPMSGQCLSSPAPSVSAKVGAGATSTFAVFVQGNGDVPFEPAANRVFVQFQDASGAIRGSASVAVRTQ